MAIGNNNQTANSATQWVVEIYPFQAADPQFDNTDSSVNVSIIGTSASALGFAAGALPSSTPVIPDKNQNTGLKTVTLRRDKTSPAGNCSLSFVGHVPDGVIPGSWIIASSLYRLDSASQKSQLIRFIGQIYEVDTSYIVQPSGLVSLSTTAQAREWSAALQAAVQFDDLSMFRELVPGVPSSGQVLLQNFDKGDAESVLDLLQHSYTAFEFAQVVLRLIGGINADHTIGRIKDLVSDTYSEVALTMPSIPQEILTRLGFPEADPENPFNTGFVTTITGVQPSQSLPAKWNGVFDVGAFSDYQKSVYVPEDRPAALGLAALAQPGIVAWDLITSYCEPSVNEMFTDIFYEKATVDGVQQIVARPSIVIRDKPYLLSKMKDRLLIENPGGQLDNWTIYDDIPRVEVPNSFIHGFKVGHTFVNSPNLIQVALQSAGAAEDFEKGQMQAAGRLRLEKQMRRFGGYQHRMETSYFSPESGSDFDYITWFKTIRMLSTGWNAYDYRFGNGTLLLADGPFALSVGFNVQFQFGSFTLVGQVDSLDMSQRIGETGVSETRLQAHLSRVVKLLPDGTLDWLDMDDFGKLTLPTSNGKQDTDQGIGLGTTVNFSPASLPSLPSLGD